MASIDQSVSTSPAAMAGDKSPDIEWIEHVFQELQGAIDDFPVLRLQTDVCRMQLEAGVQQHQQPKNTLQFLYDRLRHGVAGVDTPGADFVALAAGVTAMILASWLWVRRRRWGRPRLPDRALHPGSTLALGAAVTAVDLPTAFPYFGAIGVIVGSGVSLVAELLLLIMFNVLYVLPLALVLAAHVVLRERCESALSPARGAIERYAAPLLAAATLAVGCVLFVRGASGLIG